MINAKQSFINWQRAIPLHLQITCETYHFYIFCHCWGWLLSSSSLVCMIWVGVGAGSWCLNCLPTEKSTNRIVWVLSEIGSKADKDIENNPDVWMRPMMNVYSEERVIPKILFTFSLFFDFRSSKISDCHFMIVFLLVFVALFTELL